MSTCISPSRPQAPALQGAPGPVPARSPRPHPCKEPQAPSSRTHPGEEGRHSRHGSRRRKKRVPDGGGILRGADVEELAAQSLPVRCCGPAPSVSEEAAEEEDVWLDSLWGAVLLEDAPRAP